jgi:hypothetical protein
LLAVYLSHADLRAHVLTYTQHTHTHTHTHTVTHQLFPLKKTDNRRPLLGLGIDLFRVRVFDAVKKAVTKATLALITADRDGDVSVDRALLRGVTQVYVDMGARVYVTELLPHVLKRTKQYYSKVVAAWARDETLPSFVHRVATVLEAEEARCDAYLDADGTSLPLHKQTCRVVSCRLVSSRLVSSRLVSSRLVKREAFFVLGLLFSARSTLTLTLTLPPPPHKLDTVHCSVARCAARRPLRRVVAAAADNGDWKDR